MASEKETKFKLSLDNKEFIESALHSKESIMSLGEAKNLTGLVEGLTKVGVTLGVVGVAAWGIKTAFETVFEGEEIRQINKEFDVLTEKAGIATDALKEGLVKAAGGLVDDTELLKAANKAIIEMGNSAQRLPEVMELARKSTAVFGGDLAQNFETMNQAIASGNTRMLKHMGIIVDAQKAVKDYANANGLAVNELSQAGKQQAIMNAVLEQGGKAFEGINGDGKEATNTFQQLKVTFAEIGETITLVFEKTAGPVVREFLKNTKNVVKDFSLYIKETLGDGAEASNAAFERAGRQVEDLQARIEEVKKNGAGWAAAFTGTNAEAELQKLNDQLVAAKAHLEELKAKRPEGPEGESEDRSAAEAVDLEKRKANAAQFHKEMLALEKDRFKEQETLVNSQADIEAAVNEKRKLLEEDYNQQVLALEQNQHLNATQKAEERVQIEALRIQRIKNLEKGLADYKNSLNQNYLKNSENTAQGITRAFQVGSAQNQKAMQDFGKMGAQTFDNFAKHSKSALLDFGAGTKSAADAAKGFILNMVADEAEARGSVMLLASIWPPNPVGLAAGGGLIALAGMLRSMAGGGSGSGVGASGGGASGVAGGEGFGTRTDDRPTLQEQKAQRGVTVQVQGNYFETEQSRMAMVDLIRQNQDATDFKVQQVGG